MFSSQSRADKAGVMMVCFAAGVYMIGLGAPYWARAEVLRGQYDGSNLTYTFHEGLWGVCVSAVLSTITAEGCVMMDTEGEAGFIALLHVHHVVLCLGVVGFIVMCSHVLVVSCCHFFQGSSGRVLEVLAVFTGLLGLAGCATYDPMRIPSLSALSERLDWTWDWAFYLTALGSCLSLLAGGVLATNDNPSAEELVDAGRTKTVIVLPA